MNPFDKRFLEAVKRTRSLTKEPEYLPMEVTIRERQWGRAISTEEFVRRIRKLNPALYYVPNPMYPSKGAIMLNIPGAEPELVSPCETPIMPEWSIFVSAETRRSAWDSVPVYTPKPRYEAMRGWRTILLRMLHRGIVSLEMVEKEFGAGMRESWYQLTGKSKTVYLNEGKEKSNGQKLK